MAAIMNAAPARTHESAALPLAGWLTAFADWRRARRAEAELRALPDHILDDLGLGRGDIGTAVRTGRR